MVPQFKTKRRGIARFIILRVILIIVGLVILHVTMIRSFAIHLTLIQLDSSLVVPLNLLYLVRLRLLIDIWDVKVWQLLFLAKFFRSHLKILVLLALYFKESQNVFVHWAALDPKLWVRPDGGDEPREERLKLHAIKVVARVHRHFDQEGLQFVQGNTGPLQRRELNHDHVVELAQDLRTQRNLVALLLFIGFQQLLTEFREQLQLLLVLFLRLLMGFVLLINLLLEGRISQLLDPPFVGVCHRGIFALLALPLHLFFYLFGLRFSCLFGFFT